jgi:hypothetical protein
MLWVKISHNKLTARLQDTSSFREEFAYVDDMR